MDRDTVSPKGALLKILKDLRNRTTDILIGTQMVAKGHDFPYITLVGIICADISFNFPDFRSSERMFQLLLQVSGRAGRGESPGQIILQTYNAEHFLIAAATRQDYDAFYEKEIRFRQNLKYPPFSRLIQIKIFGKDAEKARSHALAIGQVCCSLKKSISSAAAVEILGPIESCLPRIARYYRWQILLKSPRTTPLRRMVRELIFTHQKAIGHPQVTVAFDVDPVFMF
jgi:primosomal protein N' (replication factor Y) (superfamily II helicase)